MRTYLAGLGLGLSIASYHTLHHRPIRLDGPVALSSSDFHTKSAPSLGLRRTQLNPATVREISGGSIIGLCAGLAVSTFSRPLALLIGLLVVGVQWAANHGINLVPYTCLQRYVTSIDLRSAVQDHVAFKLSFGSTFALAAFMRF